MLTDQEIQRIRYSGLRYPTHVTTYTMIFGALLGRIVTYEETLDAIKRVNALTPHLSFSDSQ